MESSFIVRVQRIDHIEFAVIGKYKFKDESVWNLKKMKDLSSIRECGIEYMIVYDF